MSVILPALVSTAVIVPLSSVTVMKAVPALFSTTSTAWTSPPRPPWPEAGRAGEPRVGRGPSPDFALELPEDELAALWLMPAAAPARTHAPAAATAAIFLPLCMVVSLCSDGRAFSPHGMSGASRAALGSPSEQPGSSLSRGARAPARKPSSSALTASGDCCWTQWPAPGTTTCLRRSVTQPSIASAGMKFLTMSSSPVRNIAGCSILRSP